MRPRVYVIGTGGSTGNVNFRRMFDPRLTEEYCGLAGMPYSDQDASGELAAMVLIERAYGSKPKYNYYLGTSQGGREALTVAQRKEWVRVLRAQAEEAVTAAKTGHPPAAGGGGHHHGHHGGGHHHHSKHGHGGDGEHRSQRPARQRHDHDQQPERDSQSSAP